MIWVAEMVAKVHRDLRQGDDKGKRYSLRESTVLFHIQDDLHNLEARMLINRMINDVRFAVDPHSGSNLYFPEYFAKQIVDNALDQILDLLYLQKGEYVPLAMTWEITNACNFCCPFCYINTQQKTKKNIVEFNHKVKSDLDYLIDKGLLICDLTGGEILTHPQFEEIYLYLKQKGVLVALLTNLSLLNRKHIELFKKYPPYKVSVSIYGLSDDGFKSVTGNTSFAYDHILNNILKLQNNGISITCQTPVNSYTIGEYIQIGKWCEEHNLKYTCSNELNPTYQGKKLDEYYVSLDTFERYKKQIKRVQVVHSQELPQLTSVKDYKRHFDCRSGKHTFVLSYDYFLRPCFVLYGNDHRRFCAEESMQTAFENMIQYINNMRCKVIPYCHGCVANSICNECLFTQSKHADLEIYMKKQCEKTMDKYLELCSLIKA